MSYLSNRAEVVWLSLNPSKLERSPTRYSSSLIFVAQKKVRSGKVSLSRWNAVTLALEECGIQWSHWLKRVTIEIVELSKWSKQLHFLHMCDAVPWKASLQWINESRSNAQWFEMMWNRRVEYWATRSSVRSFTRTAHSFTCSALLASLARSAALIHSLACSLTLKLMGKRFLSTNWMRWFYTVSSHCALRSLVCALTSELLVKCDFWFPWIRLFYTVVVSL